ncbi:2TM domain-containing protein [Flavobacterium piscis]|uniref:2TM domain-containing protein n=1 Tax=Flavobacterium piscis TaxID=1114874 RepID=A0ABU1Y844_9FLAO|nr:2TM domain-containing protein [Flavobacterium piscis]MDR7210407.1 hypothetical protein [Flavobacterium piscis]
MQTKLDNDQKELERKLHKLASKNVAKLKAFYSHAFIYIIGVIIYILKEYFGAPFNFFPIQYLNWFVMCIWTTVFLVSAVELFTYNNIFGKEWEKRKLKDILEKKTTTQKWE